MRPDEREAAEFMVNACLSEQFKAQLTEWEDRFCRDIAEVLRVRATLTVRQYEALEKIFDKVNV